jgi:hypothetical protein
MQGPVFKVTLRSGGVKNCPDLNRVAVEVASCGAQVDALPALGSVSVKRAP